MHVEASRGHVHADRGEQHHRLVGHHLQQLALGADEAVRGARLVGPEDEKDRGQRQGEHDQQQVRAGEEQAAGEDHEDQEEEDVVILGAANDDVLLVPELPDVEERLPDRRPPPRLHPRRDLSVEPGEEPAGQGGRDEIDQESDEGRHGRRRQTGSASARTSPPRRRSRKILCSLRNSAR